MLGNVKVCDAGHAGDEDEPITPERLEVPKSLIDRGSTAQHVGASAEPPTLQPLAAVPVSASDKGSSAEGGVAHQPAHAEPSADISYYSFYREEPQPESPGSATSNIAVGPAQLSSTAVSRAPESGQLSGNYTAVPVAEKATALLTAAAASLSAPTEATQHRESASPTTAGGLQQEASRAWSSSMSEERGPSLATRSSVGSRSQEALKLLSLSGTGRSSARLQALIHTSYCLPLPTGGSTGLSACLEHNMRMQVQVDPSNPWQRHSHSQAQTPHLLQGRRTRPRDPPGSAPAGESRSCPQSAPDMAPTHPETREASLGQAQADGQLRRRTPVPGAGHCPGGRLSAPTLHGIVINVPTSYFQLHGWDRGSLW